MEQLLHYIWKHRILPLHELRTTDGRAVEIIDPGLHNTHSGPDFFNAKLRIDGTMWVGNVEIHERSADWFMHSHDQDPAYNNVVLHEGFIKRTQRGRMVTPLAYQHLGRPMTGSNAVEPSLFD